MLYFKFLSLLLSHLCLLSFVNGHFCKEGWCLEANPIPSSQFGDLCRMCSRIDTPEHRRGKLDSNGPWRCPLHCAANPSGLPLCGKVSDMKVPCKMSDLKHRKHSQPLNKPSASDWDIQDEIESPHKTQIDKRQRGRKGSRTGVRGEGSKQNDMELKEQEEATYRIDYGEAFINSILNDEDVRRRRGKRRNLQEISNISISFNYTLNNNSVSSNKKQDGVIGDNDTLVQKIRRLTDNNNGRGSMKSKQNSRSQSSLMPEGDISDFHKLHLYDQKLGKEYSHETVQHIYANDYNKNYFQQKELKKQTMLKVHEDTFIPKSCSESDVVMQFESKNIQCGLWNENGEISRQTSSAQHTKKDKDYIDTNIVTHLNLSAHQIGVCIAGSVAPFNYKQYREHLSAMLFSLSKEIKSQGGVFDVFVHVNKVANVSHQILSSTLKFLQPVSCALHVAHSPPPSPCLKSGYAGFSYMRSCMQDMELYESKTRRGIPYRSVIYLRPGFYSNRALPPIQQWMHLKDDVIWTAIGPKQPRALLKQFDDPIDHMFALLPRKYASVYMKTPADEMDACLPMVAGQPKPKLKPPRAVDLTVTDKVQEEDRKDGDSTKPFREMKYKELKHNYTSYAVKSDRARSGGSGGSVNPLIEWDKSDSLEAAAVRKRKRRRKGKMGSVGAAGHIERRQLLNSLEKRVLFEATKDSRAKNKSEEELEVIQGEVEEQQFQQSHQNRRLGLVNSDSCFKRWNIPMCRLEQVVRSLGVRVAVFPFNKFGFLCARNTFKGTTTMVDAINGDCSLIITPYTADILPQISNKVMLGSLNRMYSDTTLTASSSVHPMLYHLRQQFTVKGRQPTTLADRESNDAVEMMIHCKEGDDGDKRDCFDEKRDNENLPFMTQCLPFSSFPVFAYPI